ncbi:MAG: hypothetical protein ABIF10_01840 [Candidatus Woesearchaeota archaeon]
MPILSKKDDNQERDEQLKILATNLEIINQRLSSGVGGGSVDLSNTERLIDSQHNFIMKSIKDLEERILKIMDSSNVQGQLSKQQQEIVAATKAARNEIIKEVRENNALNAFAKGEQNIVQEIHKGMEFSLSLNKNLPLLFELLKETIRLLREQNRLLRED